MKDLLASAPAHQRQEFLDYLDDYFPDGLSDQRFSDGFDFDRFKRIVRSRYKLWDSWDPLDYEAVKVLSGPRVTCTQEAALVCWNHNETWFREQVMTWMELACIKDAPEEERLIFLEHSPMCTLYTRHKVYELGC